MIILSNTTDTLKVVLGSAITTNQLPVFVSFRDRTNTTFSPDRQFSTTNSTTNVTILSSPASSTQRIVDFLSIYNNDTVNATVTVSFYDNSTQYILKKITLAPTETLEYQEGQGWKVTANTGAIKTSLNQGTNATSSGFTTVVLGSDVTNNNAVANTIADVTGLSFPVTAGSTYWFRFYIFYSAAATTTGSRWTVNGPSITALSYRSDYSLTTTSRTTNDGLTAYDLPAASNASSAVTTTGNFAVVEGFITPSASGSVIARFASEISSSAIVAKAGSMVCYQQVI